MEKWEVYIVVVEKIWIDDKGSKRITNLDPILELEKASALNVDIDESYEQAKWPRILFFP